VQVDCGQPARVRCLREVAEFEFAEDFLPVYDVSDAVGDGG
jgi:hypothetical protein